MSKKNTFILLFFPIFFSLPLQAQTPDLEALEFLTELGEDGTSGSNRDDDKTGGYKSFVQNEYEGIVKQLKESANTYQKAGRPELAEKEILELEVIKKYLPEIYSEEQTLDLVKKVIAQTAANNLSEMGKVMSIVMQQSNGKVDGGIANRLVKELLK